MLPVRPSIHALALLAILGQPSLILPQAIPQNGHDSAPSTSSKDITVTITMPTNTIAAGETPVALVTIKNISSEDITYPTTWLHVEGDRGEPATTLRQRQLTSRRKPGEPSLSGSSFEPTIDPGQSITRKYSLADLYDLTAPGKYTVYAVVLDSFHVNNWQGGWVRSAPATFEITGTN